MSSSPGSPFTPVTPSPLFLFGVKRFANLTSPNSTPPLRRRDHGENPARGHLDERHHRCFQGSHQGPADGVCAASEAALEVRQQDQDVLPEGLIYSEEKRGCLTLGSFLLHWWRDGWEDFVACVCTIWRGQAVSGRRQRGHGIVCIVASSMQRVCSPFVLLESGLRSGAHPSVAMDNTIQLYESYPSVLSTSL